MRNRNRYADGWQDVIRPAILKRDNYKCKRCGAPQRSVGYYEPNETFIVCDPFMEAWAKRSGKKLYRIHLQVAHLDNIPGNNEPKNLQTLCPRHHLQMDNSRTILIRGKQVKFVEGWIATR